MSQLKSGDYMENYFWNTEEQSTDHSLYILVIYDIVNNSKRAKFAKVMSSYGFRVQKSAFEAMISRKLYEKLLREIPKYIDRSEDSVRVYKIIGSGEVTLFGNNFSVEKEDVIII